MHKVSNNYESREVLFKEVYPGEVFSFAEKELYPRYYIKNAIGDNLSCATWLLNGSVIAVQDSVKVIVYPNAKFNFN